MKSLLSRPSTATLAKARATVPWASLLAATLVAGGLSACGGGGDAAASSTGNLRLALTDAPACGYQAVNVTVDRVRVHRSAGAAEGDAGWQEIVLSPARRIDLLTLQNGVLAELGQIPLPAGDYTQLRLVLAANGAGALLANSVRPSSAPGQEFALTTPSALQSGLKANVNIRVEPDRLADFVIDFKVCESVVKAGNSGRYLLKPVLQVMPRYVSGVSGSVVLGEGGAGAVLSLQQSGEELRSTTADPEGRFLLQPVAPGNYTLVVTAPERTTTVVTGVGVQAEALTRLPAGLTLQASGSGEVRGSVSGLAAPVVADLEMRQTLQGGASILVARQPADGDTGAWSFSLPLQAPRVAPYAGPGTALVFSADLAAAGAYSVTARSGSVALAAVPVSLSASAPALVPPLNFP